MPLGTLRQCLLYPSTQSFDGEKIASYMKELHLQHLIPFLDKAYDYQNRLSLGEQQRINFIRALLRQPACLFMDEPIAHLNKYYADLAFESPAKHLPRTGIFIVSHQEIARFEKIPLAEG